jgi:hypothetical protein
MVLSVRRMCFGSGSVSVGVVECKFGMLVNWRFGFTRVVVENGCKCWNFCGVFTCRDFFALGYLRMDLRNDF